MGGMRDLKLEGATPLVTVRSAVTSTDSSLPDATESGDYLVNPGAYSTARVFVAATSTGAAGAVTYELEVWLRKHGHSGVHGRLAQPVRFVGDVVSGEARCYPMAVLLNDEGNSSYAWVFDVPVNGDDLYVRVTNVSDGGGGPTGFSVNIWASWRGSDA